MQASLPTGKFAYWQLCLLPAELSRRRRKATALDVGAGGRAELVLKAAGGTLAVRSMTMSIERGGALSAAAGDAGA